MERKIYRDESGFAALRPQWNDLLAQSRFNTLFLTWEWQSTWWRCLGRGELWLLAWYEENQLIAIAPLYLAADDDGHYRLRLVGCIEVSDYLDIIIASGHEEAVYSALLSWLAGPEAPAWEEASLCNLPQQSLSHRLLPELAAAHQLEGVTVLEDVCPIIDLPGDWETYLQDCLSKKQRHEVRRKMRKIEQEARVRWYLVNGSPDLQEEMDAFIRLHRLSAQEKHSFMTPEMESFFMDMTRTMHGAGWLHLAFIEVNGDKAAAMLSFRYRDRIMVYNSGYDPDSYASLSPGIVLTAYVIEDAIQSGYRLFDFLQGDEVYKYRFGASDTVVYSTTLRRANPPS